VIKKDLIYYSHPSNRNPKTFLFHKSPKNLSPFGLGFFCG